MFKQAVCSTCGAVSAALRLLRNVVVSALAASAILAGASRAQEARPISAFEGFPVPSCDQPLSQNRQESAIIELHAFRAAVSMATWSSIVMQGHLSLPNGEPQPATIYVGDIHSSRMDFIAGNPRSIRISEDQGFQGTAESHSSLLAEHSAVGVIPYPRAWSDLQEDSASRISDAGRQDVFGQSLRRITLLQTSKNGAAGCSDLYFDGATHLLMYSVDSLPLHSSDGVRIARITSYSDYQMVGTVRVPARLAQYVRGQLLWTFSMSSAQTSGKLDPDLFRF